MHEYVTAHCFSVVMDSFVAGSVKYVLSIRVFKHTDCSSQAVLTLDGRGWTTAE